MDSNTVQVEERTRPDLAGVTGVKIWSATRHEDRQAIGDSITRWIRDARPKILDYVVKQSSDHSFHCLSITIFYGGAT